MLLTTLQFFCDQGKVILKLFFFCFGTTDSNTQENLINDFIRTTCALTSPRLLFKAPRNIPKGGQQNWGIAQRLHPSPTWQELR